KRAGRAQVRGWPLNCDVLPLNIKGASRFLRKWPAATLDIEPPEALWPEAKGQAASLARVRGHPLHAAAVTGQIPGAAAHSRRVRPWTTGTKCRSRPGTTRRPGDDEHQGDENLENCLHPGLPPRAPRLWARRPC